jgi:hypothetical protein
VVIELWAVEAFCLTPVIACLFFVAGVLSALVMQVSDVFCRVRPSALKFRPPNSEKDFR